MREVRSWEKGEENWNGEWKMEKLNNMVLEIYKGGIPVIEVLDRWYNDFKLEGYGAMIPFIGIVRPDNGIEGLSFDLYLPLLSEWFKKWSTLKEAKITMAHGFGDVMVGETSFLCAVYTKHRSEGFKYLEMFVEDFKANAPIWKYDLKNGKRIFASDRAKVLPQAGILK